ncbi:peptide/nickel transport system permease protein [Rhizobiales bacterium GAS191]|jgi:peptide/nickel transport system permease protein|nr:peptide/nickel transport system permease protein [Rhizobiales bacterium GAS113]SED94213.1 peptide/nickel transport system permease protein [Rhizobiales bacterium GAS188]SEE57448.1 peptide/nickel transport system permease protein [Rhizobiales bacterium GAS191]
MARFILRRLISAVPILLLVSLITFGLMRLVPGDPSAVIAGLSATPEQIAAIRSQLGLDQSLPVQLMRWYGGLLHGDLGRSLLLGQPVVEATFLRLPVTLALSAYALVLTLLIGLISGILAALKQNTIVDQLAMLFAMFGISMPSFWLGLLMILVFAVHLGWLPTGGYIAFTDDPVGWLRTSTMPAISLALLQAGLLARITRSTMLEVLRQDYIRTARAKGLPQRLVVFKHALANALIPITTVIGIILGLLISASVVIETMFSIPGIGQLLTQAVLNRDYPMVQGGLLIVTGLLVLTNLLVDMGYALLDPRVRYESS